MILILLCSCSQNATKLSPVPNKGECCIFDSWEISRLVFVEHFKSFGFACRVVASFEELCQLGVGVVIAVTELDENEQEMKQRVKELKAKFKIAICRLRSPNEVRTEPGIDAIISRHIKRESLQNIVTQLMTSGNTVQAASRHAPYLLSALI